MNTEEQNERLLTAHEINQVTTGFRDTNAIVRLLKAQDAKSYAAGLDDGYATGKAAGKRERPDKRF